MSDYGRSGTRDRGYDRDLDWERGRDRDRSGFFGWTRDDDRDDRRGYSEESRSRPAEARGRSGRERDYGYDDRHEGLPIDETGRLIASNKVEGTPVYGRRGDRLGTIYNFMVDKYSGQVEYAVMSYGGFLGMGQRYYPLPWRILSYDTREGGYRIDMSERDLERAPSFGRDDEPRFSSDYGRRINDWYGVGR
jgi:sporulation protein YlmC with PRC-barrel domain